MQALQEPAALPPVVRVAAGDDIAGEYRGLGISRIAFKTVPQDGSILIIENIFHAPGGPARHLHYDQDEWFYALEGQFILEVGQTRLTLNPGDSLLAPRQVPHVWAYTGHPDGTQSSTQTSTQGKMLIAFLPAGQMAAFFAEVTRAGAMPPQDPALWRAHGMELLGPPLSLA